MIHAFLSEGCPGTPCRYSKLVFYMEACESGSMFKTLPTDLNIFATTAANAKESSWGTYCPPHDQVRVGDRVRGRDGTPLHPRNPLLPVFVLCCFKSCMVILTTDSICFKFKFKLCSDSRSALLGERKAHRLLSRRSLFGQLDGGL